MGEERSRGGFSGISGGPLLVGLVLGAGLGTLICKMGGLNYACLMRKLKRLMGEPSKKKCSAAVATVAVAEAPPSVETPPPAAGGDFPKKPCKPKKKE